MSDTYIQSVTISIPSYMVLWQTKSVFLLLQSWKCGTYRKYGHTSLFMIYTQELDANYFIWTYISHFISTLQFCGILSSALTINHLEIHEIKLRFEINVPEAIFCKVERFNKVTNTNTYYSDDNKKYLRRKKNTLLDKEKTESKGRQYSFLSVIQSSEGSSVILTFSGKYRKNISIYDLMNSNDNLIQWLCILGSFYLPIITDSDSFKVVYEYSLYYPKFFQYMLNNANWYGGVLF